MAQQQAHKAHGAVSAQQTKAVETAVLAARLIVDKLAGGDFGRYCGLHSQRELKWHSLDIACEAYRAIEGRDPNDTLKSCMYNRLAVIYPLVRGGEHE